MTQLMQLVVILGFFLLLGGLALFLMVRSYRKVEPGRAMVYFGGLHEVKIQDVKTGKTRIVRCGYEVVTSGTFFKKPVISDVKEMSAGLKSLDVKVPKAIARDGTFLDIAARARVTTGDQMLLSIKAECLLSRAEDEVDDYLRLCLEESIREAVAKVTGDEAKKASTIEKQSVGPCNVNLSFCGYVLESIKIESAAVTGAIRLR